ncbi:MAG: acetate/propionate family kinase [Nitrospira sp.]|nr:acetate/propionate family kinase [Nitrospira sp.]MBH0182067.1 acetate/propionate family kinase [Nitrospira sp.]MBH0185264.1 acetate/propionate family kinase [Nitrospira sp.]
MPGSGNEGSGSILVINGGSSTLKFALFRIGDGLVRELSGLIDRIGSAHDTFMWTQEGVSHGDRRRVAAPNHAACLEPMMDYLDDKLAREPLAAIGHRVVHGGKEYREPQRVTPVVMEELQRLSPYDPEHLPAEIALIEECVRRYPRLPQVVCFDTTFHRDMPNVARLLPIPRRYEKLGIQRYGFHGLSCSFLMKELARVGRKSEANGRIILAHLGNGASMTAVKDGKSIETTMGFTPASGMPMSRRSGDLDPGLVSYLARTEGMTVEQFHRMANSESGLLGVSEISADMRDLLKEEGNDPRAAEAVALFCYQAKKTIGSLAAALGGLDTLVFSAGIGEHAPVIRARICDGLEFLGVVIDHACNQKNDAVISKEGGRVTVRVIPTDEEREIAASVMALLSAG